MDFSLLLEPLQATKTMAKVQFTLLSLTHPKVKFPAKLKMEIVGIRTEVRNTQPQTSRG